MAQTRGSFPQLYDNVDKLIFTLAFDTNKSLPSVWRDIYEIRTSDKKFERVQGVVGMQDVPEKGEGMAADGCLRGTYRCWVERLYVRAFGQTLAKHGDDCLQLPRVLFSHHRKRVCLRLADVLRVLHAQQLALSAWDS